MRHARLLAASILLILAILLPLSQVWASTLYEYYNTGDGGATGFFGDNWRAQTFTPTSSHIITSAKLKLYRDGSPGTVTVSIRATDGDGHPTGSDLCAGTIDGNTLTTDTGGEWREITFGSGYGLSGGIKYAIVIRAVASWGGWRGTEEGSYPGGNCEYSSNAGSTWTTTGEDNMFEEWGILPTTSSNISITADPSYATGEPTVTASDATGIGTDEGTLHGNITDNGGGDITMRGFEWGTETGNYTSSWNQTGSFTIGAFDHAITGLDFCTEIFWRAFAVNSYGQGNSTEESFTTSCLPSAPTDFTVTQIGINSANISWTMGYAANSTVIVVGEGSCPDSPSDGPEVYSGNGTSVIVNGLMFELTTYCYRAWSLNEYGYSVDYAEDTIGNAIGLPNILFVVGLCGYALWRKDWIRVLLALCIIAWGAFAFDYDVKIAVPLVAVGTMLFFMGILRIIEQRQQEGT